MKKKAKNKRALDSSLKTKTKKVNPFEVHINRKKYDILGMKSKAERGLPGVSRSRSLKKRKGTLLQEYQLKDKRNLFLDRRIGERNSAMTSEDKIMARFTAQRMKFYSKKSIYNLGDDEELTHRGQTLSEIEKFDNPKSEDEDEEDDGKLDSNFVEDAHFGGGIFRKVEGESKSRKDIIDQLIAESIKRKAEKQKLRQQTLDLTEQIDTDWKELLPLVTASKKSKLDAEQDDKKDDKFAEYDILSKKLKFETRGKPSDKLKSEEEIAKEEKEKLEKLENDRIQRMLGEFTAKGIKHRSADDMDDGFDLGDEPETFLVYKDGVLNSEFGTNGESEGPDKEIKKSKEDRSVSEESEAESENNECDKEAEKNADEESANDDNDSDEEGEGEEDSESDHLSDLKESDSSDEEDMEMQADSFSPKKTTAVEKKVTAAKEKEEGKKPAQTRAEDKEENSTQEQKAVEAAKNELPYTFKIPQDYDNFEKLIADHDLDHQLVIIERMIKCHHPSLKEEHKYDLDRLFTFILQYLQDSASDRSTQADCFKVLEKLASPLFDLTQWNPKNSASNLMEVIQEKYDDFKKHPKIFPKLDTLIFLKLVSILFPTSDFRHSVVTPTLLFIEQALFQCRVKNSKDISIGLFLSTLVYEYCALSKRFVPEALNFIHCILRLAHPKESKIPVRLPLQPNIMASLDLIVRDKFSEIKLGKPSIKDLNEENSSEQFKMNTLSLALTLLSRFCDFWTGKQGAILVFEPFIPLLDAAQFHNKLKNVVEEISNKIVAFQKEPLTMLVLERKKPKPLRLYEPKIEEVHSLKKYRPMGKEKAERAKLLHKYKREMKGALREIRRDRSFLSKLKFKDTMKSDTERQRKVREIMSAAAEQQGELRKLKRKKK